MFNAKNVSSGDLYADLSYRPILMFREGETRIVEDRARPELEKFCFPHCKPPQLVIWELEEVLQGPTPLEMFISTRELPAAPVVEEPVVEEPVVEEPVVEEPVVEEPRLQVVEPEKELVPVPDQFRDKVLNLQKDDFDPRDMRMNAAPMLAAVIPPKVDHTPLMSPVKDQGRLGSCVAFAVGAMKEWQEKAEDMQEVIQGLKSDWRKDQIWDYSEQWIYYKAKSIDPWPNEEGTSIRYAMKVLQKVGVPTEKAWPYNDVEIGKPESWSNMIATWALIQSYKRVMNLLELKAALANGPVPIGIPVFIEFFYPKAGVIDYPVNTNQYYGGHAICAVGYDDEKQLVKFKNSWSTAWGDKGYGYLPYRYINDFLWDAWSAEDMRVTKEMLAGKRTLEG